MINSYFKQYKTSFLQKIQDQAKQIYIFRYNDLQIKEFFLIKKYFKLNNLKCLIIKKKILINNFLNFKGQGSILIVYTTHSSNNYLFKLNTFKKLNLVAVINHNKILSPIKFKNISMQQKKLNNALFQQLFIFLILLKKLNLADIT